MYSILDMPTLYIYSLDGVKYQNIIEVVMNLNLSMYFKAIYYRSVWCFTQLTLLS